MCAASRPCRSAAVWARDERRGPSASARRHAAAQRRPWTSGKYQGHANGMPRAWRAPARIATLTARDVAVAAELGDEPAARLERAADSGEHGVGLGDPVQRGVREHRIELRLERQRARVGDCARRGRSARAAATIAARGIDADHRRAGCGDLAPSGTPSPQPRSRIRSPGVGASRAIIGAPSSRDEAAFCW